MILETAAGCMVPSPFEWDASAKTVTVFILWTTAHTRSGRKEVTHHLDRSSLLSLLRLIRKSEK